MSAKDEERRRTTSDASGSLEASESRNEPNGNAEDVEPGMVVETREGDLGESDVSTAKVKDVERDAAGDVTNVVVEKGVVFRKTLEVPPERIEAVEDSNGNSSTTEPLTTAGGSEEKGPSNKPDVGTVILDTTGQEIRDLSATGTETLNSRQPRDAKGDDRGGRETGTSGDSPTKGGAASTSVEPGDYVRTLGPGVLSGMAGNDSSAVTSYSINGATNGYGQLWLILLATPLYQAVQYACAKIGRVTQKGLADLLREHYGRKIAIPASLILVVANTALIAADLVAIGAGIQLLTGIAWEWFVVPVAVGLWYLIVYQSFGIIKKIFLAMSLVFVAYLITGVVSGAHWGEVLQATFIPHISLGLASISSAVALLGATVSPYTMYWQVQGEKEQKRPGTRKQQFRLAALDIAVGTIAGNLVAYAIIVCTAATLFTHRKEIQTAADAAAALAPLLGPYAEQLFAIGFIGSGMIAIPVLLASTSYGLSGLFGWSASLWKKPWQSEGFYLIMTGALLVSLIVALLRFDPIQLMFWANVLQGILSPVLIVFLILVGNNRKIMRSYRLSPITNVCLALTALVMASATILLFYGLLSGAGA
ncbi:MAG TPA: divalent metal cation transporter [Ktedonobacterales bacterium]|jgi:NRAMP (natural resistance-associated macrophage protein)-like metal ion transporter